MYIDLQSLPQREKKNLYKESAMPFLPASPLLSCCPLLILKPRLHSVTAGWKHKIIQHLLAPIFQNKCVQNNIKSIQNHKSDDRLYSTLSAPAYHRASPPPPSFSHCLLHCQQSNSSSVE